MPLQENISPRSLEFTTMPASDYISLLFERTDEDGVLYVPSFGMIYQEDYRCYVDWNLSKYETLQNKFEDHVNKIKQIAPILDKLDEAPENAKNIIGNDTLYEFWNTYIRKFETGNIDLEIISELEDRELTIDSVRGIAKTLADGNDLEDIDRQYLFEYMDTKITKDERKYYNQYIDTVESDAQSRIGKNQFAHTLIVRSMRLCRLFHLNAPKIITSHETNALAVSMLMFDYGISRERVDQTIRRKIEQLDDMSDDELDALYRPKKSNSTKSLLPLFVYTILKTKTNSKKHMRQKDILEELKLPPYELFIERKALSRTLQNLKEAHQFAIFSDKTGVWIDQE